MISIPDLNVPPRRLKSLRVAPDALIALFVKMQEPRTFYMRGLPSDARVVQTFVDMHTRDIVLVIESDAFAIVRSGSHLEELSFNMGEYTERVAVHR